MQSIDSDDLTLHRDVFAHRFVAEDEVLFVLRLHYFVNLTRSSCNTLGLVSSSTTRSATARGSRNAVAVGRLLMDTEIT
ncbi:hypothetical protein CC79DRAFT_866018 [Sarocladium strictum]